MRVDEIVQTDVVTVEPTTPIAMAVAMGAKDVGSVVDVEDETPVGIFTGRTIAIALETNQDVTNLRAEDHLTRDPVAGNTKTSVIDDLRRMEEVDVRRLPIVAEDGTLEGIVTLDDILVLLGAGLRNATVPIDAQLSRL